MEAMARAGTAMGLTTAQAHQLAGGLWAPPAGAPLPTSPPRAAPASPPGRHHLRALQSLEKDGVGASFERAMQAAQQRAHELGNEFGT